MNKRKTALITLVTSFKKNEIYKLSKLLYTKVFILYCGEEKPSIKIPSNLVIVKYIDGKDLNKKIDETIDNNQSYLFFPYFSGDFNSKYSIRVYNKVYSTKIDPKLFKEKDKMTDFLGEIANKKYIKLSYNNLVLKTYDNIKSELGGTFIIKPTNASGSISTFKVKCEESYINVLSKIVKSYDYLIEEYIEGDLYSIDFFFDGENMFLLSYVREILMIELFEKNKFSQDFLSKYKDEITKHFNFILPLTYNIEFSRLSKTELKLLGDLKKKLIEISYRGIIHLEYKFDSINQKAGFIEWGARFGGYRKIYIKELYNTEAKNLGKYLLFEKDFSRFTKIKNNIYKFKEKEPNLNFVRVKTNFTKTTSFVSILSKSGSVLNNSFSSFIQNFYRETYGINVKKVDFFVKHSKDYNFYPFYKTGDTKFDYILEMDDENYNIFRNKKFKIIEKVFFHDYKIFKKNIKSKN